jgi:hypothetical protein
MLTFPGILTEPQDSPRAGGIGGAPGQRGFTRVPAQSTRSDAMVSCQPQPHRNRNGMGQGRLADGVRNMSLLNLPNILPLSRGGS